MPDPCSELRTPTLGISRKRAHTLRPAQLYPAGRRLTPFEISTQPSLVPMLQPCRVPLAAPEASTLRPDKVLATSFGTSLSSSLASFGMLLARQAAPHHRSTPIPRPA